MSNHAQEYFAKVLPWPQEGDAPAYVNVHWTIDKLSERTGKPIWTGRAVRSVAEAVRTVEWAKSLPDTRDIYVCLSTQREALEKQSKTGRTYHAPIRSQTNAVALKSLYIDLDAKGEDKNSYASVSEAATALAEFIHKMYLPKPSVMVTSGGGLHVYWTFDRALTVFEWQPLATALAEATKVHGLKCDTGCTIDGARILRVPGTFNRKLDTPRAVGLAGGRTGHDYSVDRLARVLEPFRSAVAAPVLPPRVPLQGVSDLAAGIDMGGAAPVDLNNVAKHCGFINDAIATCGAALSNPLWNLTTLISTFTVGGKADAHRMASGHPGYSAASTDELYERKSRERQAKGLGWPACRTISSSGASQCASCPHFAANRTPLHLATAQPVAAVPAQPLVGGPNSPGVPGQSVGSSDLPAGYKRLASNVVCRILINSDGTATDDPLSSYPMYDPSIQVSPFRTLNFVTITETGRATQVSVPFKEGSSKEALKRLLWAEGMPVRESEVKNLQEFFVSWIQKLQQNKQAIVSSSPFGWSMNNKAEIEGFVYGGTMFFPGGSRNASMPDPILARRYKPNGKRQKWIDAAKLITDQRRPALDAIIASAFASPLVKFCNEPAILMSTFSAGSGIGKTTALKIANAVWGDPIKSLQGLDDTQNFVFGKAGQLQNIPMYWDEIRGDQDAKNFVKIAFKLTMRKEKDRMTQSATMRESGSWQLMLVSAANESIMDHVVQHTKNTAAGAYRVFEFEVPPANASTPGQIDQADASRIGNAVEDHYGHIGMEYAEYLGSNHAAIEQDVTAFYKAVGNEMSTRNEERFWRVMVATILKGAEYANKLGFTNIDGIGLKKFLFKVVDDLRQQRGAQTNDMAVTFNVAVVLAQYMNEMRARHTIRTSKIHRGRGKPPTGSVNIINDVTRLDAIYIHIGQDDKVLRLANHGLAAWLRDKGYSQTTILKSLERDFYAKRIKGRMAAGTPLAGAEEYLLEIDLAGTPHLNLIDEA